MLSRYDSMYVCDLSVVDIGAFSSILLQVVLLLPRGGENVSERQWTAESTEGTGKAVLFTQAENRVLKIMSVFPRSFNCFFCTLDFEWSFSYTIPCKQNDSVTV